MNNEEIKEQLESLIEAWYLNEADLNQTDINAIKCVLNKLELSEQKRLKAIEYIKKCACYSEQDKECKCSFSSMALDRLLKMLGESNEN